MPINKPSPTITKEGALWKKYPHTFHPKELRGISIGELRRLASFPDDFQFTGKWVDAWARIGNSVPPLLMKAIANHVAASLKRFKAAGGKEPRLI